MIEKYSQAFPRSYAYMNPEAGKSELKSVDGLTKREWFAGLALKATGLEIRHYQHEENYKLIAATAVKIADALMEELSK